MIAEQKRQKKIRLSQIVTYGDLLDYTDEFLIPKFAVLIDDSIQESEQRMDKKLKIALGQLENTLKDYIDRKFTETIEKVFRCLEKSFGKEKQFREKVLELLKKYKIGKPEDFAYLEGIIAVS